MRFSGLVNGADWPAGIDVKPAVQGQADLERGFALSDHGQDKGHIRDAPMHSLHIGLQAY